MKKPRCWIVLICMVLVLVSSQSSIFAKIDPMFFKDYGLIRRQPLIGLQGVEVYVDFHEYDIERLELNGLTRNQLHKDTEKSLRRAGIKVLSREEVSTALGRPCLYVKVDVLWTVKYAVYYRKYIPYFLYSIAVMVIQEATLVRDSNITMGTATWYDTKIGGSPDLKDIREAVAETVDDFINAYLSVNPK